jgi:NADPH-dependent F420 reductase
MLEPLRVGIIGGTGNAGRGLALRFALAAFEVTIGSREPERAVETAAGLRARRPGAAIEGASNEDAVSRADVVILAIPFSHVEAMLAQTRDAFRPGSLLIDVTVPVVFEAGAPRFVEPAEGSAAEHVRRRLPDHVALACVFKTLPARLVEDVDHPLRCDDFICGDSKPSRDRAMAIATRIPTLRPIDAGPLEAARIIERMTLLAITLNRRYKSHTVRFQVLGI